MPKLTEEFAEPADAATKEAAAGEVVHVTADQQRQLIQELALSETQNLYNHTQELRALYDSLPEEAKAKNASLLIAVINAEGLTQKALSDLNKEQSSMGMMAQMAAMTGMGKRPTGPVDNKLAKLGLSFGFGASGQPTADSKAKPAATAKPTR